MYNCIILLYNYVTGHALFFISLGMLKGVYQFFKKNDQKNRIGKKTCLNHL